MSNYNDLSIDPAMIISRTLTPTTVLTKMEGVTDKSLKNGIQVEIMDVVNDNSYFVTLRKSRKDYFFRSGWKNFTKSCGFKSGDEFNIYWDYLLSKFVILNFEYTLIE
ncbi:hypothetical protein CARUB_v10028336mg [Capsella rubella]|uniref:TF-B3 domain-containing protein n=1 Tax=Capsella rubella TaxID=81985 RepID=R0F0A5_9BRAS|nr:hypothetical protein CARUB_v10028336mg [Capsella rubella]